MSKFNKPGLNDPADIEVLNENWDKLEDLTIVDEVVNAFPPASAIYLNKVLKNKNTSEVKKCVENRKTYSYEDEVYTDVSIVTGEGYEHDVANDIWYRDGVVIPVLVVAEFPEPSSAIVGYYYFDGISLKLGKQNPATYSWQPFGSGSGSVKFKKDLQETDITQVKHIDQYSDDAIAEEGIFYTDGICCWTKQGNSIVRVYGIDDSAKAHNGVYRGNNITALFESGKLSQQVAEGNFRGIYIGDYIVKTLTVDNVSYNMKFAIAGFDIYTEKASGATIEAFAENEHRLLMINWTIPYRIRMNASNTTGNGYRGSEMRNTTLPKWSNQVVAAFGADHLYQFSQLMSITVNTSSLSTKCGTDNGRATGWSWENGNYVAIQHEMNVYGGTNYASGHTSGSGFKFPIYNFVDAAECDPDNDPFGNGKYTNHCDYWLGDVASAATFAGVDAHGDALYGNASDTLGLRFFFLLK